MNPLRTRFAVAIAILGLFLTGTAVSLSAHHSFAAEFDANRPVNFTGTITRMEWVNPHVWLHLDVKKPDGSVENWAFEAGTPSVLFRRGLTKNSLLPGTVVVVDDTKRMGRSGRTAAASPSPADTLFPGRRYGA